MYHRWNCLLQPRLVVELSECWWKMDGDGLGEPSLSIGMETVLLSHSPILPVLGAGAGGGLLGWSGGGQMS